jgi:hypothetical protein
LMWQEGNCPLFLPQQRSCSSVFFLWFFLHPLYLWSSSGLCCSFTLDAGIDLKQHLTVSSVWTRISVLVSGWIV